MLDPREKGHPYRCAPSMMVISLDVPKKGCGSREDAHFLGHARGLAYCQAQSRLGLASATPSVFGAWHTAKPSMSGKLTPDPTYFH